MASSHFWNTHGLKRVRFRKIEPALDPNRPMSVVIIRMPNPDLTLARLLLTLLQLLGVFVVIPCLVVWFWMWFCHSLEKKE